MSKEQDLKYIKEFSKIKITEICREQKIDKSNLYRGTASAESTKKVKEELKRRIEKLEK